MAITHSSFCCIALNRFDCSREDKIQLELRPASLGVCEVKSGVCRRFVALQPFAPMRSPSVSALRVLRTIGGGEYVCGSCNASAAIAAPRKHQPTTRLRRLSSISFCKDQTATAAARNGRSTFNRSRTLVLQNSAATRRQACQASASTLASSTAINPPSTVPPDLQRLHKSLAHLQDTASNYANLSRLQLALRSLESSSPVVRVALLGLGENGAQAAKKLAKVLLSDALDQEEEWERTLVEAASSDSRGLLLTYDDTESFTPGHGSQLLKTMHISSRTLHRQRLEMLISTLNTDANGSGEEKSLEEAILVPPLQTPISAGGRAGFVRYPVHAAILVGEGAEGCVGFGRLGHTLDAAEAEGNIKVALSLPQTGPSTRAMLKNSPILSVDIGLATHALNLFRANVANGAKFNEEWQSSGVPQLSEWLANTTAGTENGLKPAVRNLLHSLLISTSSAINAAELEQSSSAAFTSVPESKRSELRSAIDAWSADAHKDLQSNLSTAFASPSWRRTVWWRLLWRIDDVSVAASDVLVRSWLTEAEQSLAFLSGRIAQSGLARTDAKRQTILDPSSQAELASMNGAEKSQRTSVAELMQLPSTLAKVQQESGLNAVFTPPWPQTINFSRQSLLNTVVPALHRKAQGLLVSTLSTIGGTSALAAWFYVATSGIAMYEAGAIAALGLVWPLRRLQKFWGTEIERFEADAKEEGRKVLGEVENGLRATVRESGRVEVTDEDRKGWKEAKAAVDACGTELKKLT